MDGDSVGPGKAREEQLRYVQVVMSGIDALDERVPGYRLALKDVVVDILAIEQSHAQRRINVAQQITYKIDALGQYLVEHDWRKDGDEDQ